MNSSRKYRHLGNLKKLTLLALLCSALGFSCTLVEHTSYRPLFDASSLLNQEQMVYEFAQPEDRKSSHYMLFNKIARSSLLRNETDLHSLTDPRTHVCLASSDTPVELTGKTTNEDKIIYAEIKVLAGDCKGKIGWIQNDFIIENRNHS